MKKSTKATIYAIIICSIPVLMIFSVPKYPIIDSSLSQEIILENISKVIKQNSMKFSLENMYEKKKLFDYEESLIEFAKNLDSCETKECLIDEYNDFMNDWVSTEIKVKTRYTFMSNRFGFIGNIMNNELYWLYSI